jgi:hypothetical protein
MTKVEKHRELLNKLNEIYAKKNEAYGDSFGRTFKELGIMSAITRIYDKFNRIVALTKGAKNEIIDESIRDTLIDMANYCIMTVMELDEKDDNDKKPL